MAVDPSTLSNVTTVGSQQLTKLGDFAGYLKPEEAADYFAEAEASSVVQSLVRKVPLGIDGQAIRQVIGGPKASWVSEAGRKPVTTGRNVGVKSFMPHKLACIVVTSAEVVRKDPTGYISSLKGDIGTAFGKAFDMAALFGADQDGNALPNGGPFGYNLSTTANTAAIGSPIAFDIDGTLEGGVWFDLNNLVLKGLKDAGSKFTGIVLDDYAEIMFNNQVDRNGRPLFIDPVYTDSGLTTGRIMGRPAYLSEGLAQGTTIGFAGDWRKAVWGAVGGISYDVSTQATVTVDGALTSLWEHNLVAVRAEGEFGFMLDNPNGRDFMKITDAAAV